MTDNEHTQSRSGRAQKEEELLAFWRDRGIFERSLKQNEGNAHFVFYDGPPFATGVPHYGSILPSLIKDAIPRYRTMKGDYVRRVWGWDCHGLPIENLIEKELGFTHKSEIEEYGIERFNRAARDSVLRYDHEWKKVIPRIGRWIDMEHSYKTMDAGYTESVWWAFKTLWDKGFVYEGYKAMHICPRCETTLSNNEVSLGYKEVTDLAVTAKFALVDEPNTYLLAWTTTPWTLPGNAALAINESITYLVLRITNDDDPDARYVVAEDRADEVMGEREYEVLEKRSGADLVGKRYEPLFPYFAEADIENKENGWRIYAADFVSTESGTGIVHIAPAFGEDDMELGKRENLPFITHVTFDGRFTDEVSDFAGAPVKPADDPQATDVAIIKHLAHNGLLFSKEKVTHSYPHCWRCDTPLLNYATSSWFIAVSDLRDKLLEANSGVEWIPEHIKEGRFGNWLSNARDWSVSRARFWGAPLPVWQCESCGTQTVIGSVDELREKQGYTTPRNQFWVMRHGQAESNVQGITSASPEHEHHLTEKGKEEVRTAARELAETGVDHIYASDFVRTRETAELIADELALPRDRIILDTRLREINTGVFDQKPDDEYHGYFSSLREKFTKRPPEGETITEVRQRVMRALSDIDEAHTDKRIVCVTHEYPAWMLVAGSKGASIDETVRMKEENPHIVPTASVTPITYVPFPHNPEYELDLHRPYIDGVVLSCATCGGRSTRIPEVFDCWIESGSMPFAQFHYPFENEETFARNFPADFIAEGLDQTRGWFYTMMVLSVALFDMAPYKNVICHGLIQAEDGQKMSKKLKNYPEPMDVISRYGADALRYYLLSSPVVRGEELRFSEGGVEEASKKVIGRLLNVVAFYELYAAYEHGAADEEGHVLDRWIHARSNAMVRDIAAGLDRYELDRATRPIGTFVDDLSTWYLRRSRERIKSGTPEDKRAALATVHEVLLTCAKAIAPIMPFVADEIYGRIAGDADVPSIHLTAWPESHEPNEEEHSLFEKMQKARTAVSHALERRAEAGMKVRQPLASLTIGSAFSEIANDNELTKIIADEVNVKEVRFDASLEEPVALDTEITEALEREGMMREFTRFVQEARKNAGLTPDQYAALTVATDEAGKEFIESFRSEIMTATLLSSITYAETLEDGKTFPVGELSFSVAVYG